jgi:hypothetical protein
VGEEKVRSGDVGGGCIGGKRGAARETERPPLPPGLIDPPGPFHNKAAHSPPADGVDIKGVSWVTLRKPRLRRPNMLVRANGLRSKVMAVVVMVVEDSGWIVAG